MGQYDFHGGVDVLCTAHFKIDPATGDMLFFAATGPVITWYRADVRTGGVIDSHVLEIGVPVLMHDFAVSENYAVFFVTPAQFRLDLIMQSRPGVVWDESATPHGVQIVLMDRRTHKVTWHDLGGQFANTHFYNAFELGDEVIVDGHRIERLGNPVERLQTPLSSHEWFPPALPYRWRSTSRRARPARNGSAAWPASSPRSTTPSSVGSTATVLRHDPSLESQTMTDGLAKHDYLLDSTTVVDGPDSLTNPSEPVFVPRENARGEDDGYLLTVCGTVRRASAKCSCTMRPTCAAHRWPGSSSPAGCPSGSTAAGPRPTCSTRRSPPGTAPPDGAARAGNPLSDDVAAAQGFSAPAPTRNGPRGRPRTPHRRRFPPLSKSS